MTHDLVVAERVGIAPAVGLADLELVSRLSAVDRDDEAVRIYAERQQSSVQLRSHFFGDP